MSTVVNSGLAELAVSPRQVARYAGGTRYRMDASQRTRVAAVLEWASQLVGPAFVYSIHAVTGIREGGYVTLENHTTFRMPAGEHDPGMKYLAFCVCTIGGKLEQRVRTVMAAGQSLEGLFLDAAGVAILEAVSARAHDTLRKQAQERGLHCSCRFGPGYGSLDLMFQEQVFALVDASSIDVRLNELCVMTPEKSLSFFTKWTTSPVPVDGLNKCASCTLTHCLYRC